MKYIVVFETFNSEKVYYCDTILEVKQTVEQISSLKEIKKGKVRVFKIESELDLKKLLVPTKKDADEGEDYDLNKVKEHIQEIFYSKSQSKIRKYQRPKPPMILVEKIFKELSKMSKYRCRGR